MAISTRLPNVRDRLPKRPMDDAPYDDVSEEMTLAEHLAELRSRLIKIVVGVILAFMVGLFLTNPVFRLIRDTSNLHNELFDVQEATEPIVAYFKTALYIAVAIALPLIMYQLFAFIAPGLTRKEKRLLYGSLPFVAGLFLLGASFAFFFAVPRALMFLSEFNSDLFEYSPRYESLLSFYLQVSLGMGIAFQLPIVMYLLARLQIVTSHRMRRSRRVAFVLVLIAAAIITPTPDPFNMLFVAAPIYLLFEVGLLFAKLGERRTQRARALT